MRSIVDRDRASSSSKSAMENSSTPPAASASCGGSLDCTVEARCDEDDWIVVGGADELAVGAAELSVVGAAEDDEIVCWLGDEIVTLSVNAMVLEEDEVDQGEGEDEQGEGEEQLCVEDVELRQVVDQLRLITCCCPWSRFKGNSVKKIKMNFKRKMSPPPRRFQEQPRGTGEEMKRNSKWKSDRMKLKMKISKMITNQEEVEERGRGEDGDQEREGVQEEVSGGRPAVRPYPPGPALPAADCLAPPESPACPAWRSWLAGRRGRTFASANRLSHARVVANPGVRGLRAAGAGRGVKGPGNMNT